MESTKLSKKKASQVYIASGSTHPELADETAAAMGLRVNELEKRTFANTERYVRFAESVRGKHVLAIQALAATEHGSVNDSIMELMLMIDAAKRASAKEITAVIPYMAYSRQDRKAKGREPISSATVIRMLQSAGADRIVSVDIHSAQIQAAFNDPFDHLTAEPIFVNELRERVASNTNEFVVVAPDAGRAKTSESLANQLDLDFLVIPKKRSRDNPSQIIRPETIGGVADKTAIMIDDMIDTAGTLLTASQTLKRSKALGIIACSTHGLFSEPALKRLQSSPITEIIVTNTVPQNKPKEVLGNRLSVISIAPLLGQTLVEIASGGSVSKIFNDRNYQ